MVQFLYKPGCTYFRPVIPSLSDSALSTRIIQNKVAGYKHKELSNNKISIHMWCSHSSTFRFSHFSKRTAHTNQFCGPFWNLQRNIAFYGITIKIHVLPRTRLNIQRIMYRGTLIFQLLNKSLFLTTILQLFSFVNIHHWIICEVWQFMKITYLN